MQAYMLLNCNPGLEKEIITKIKKIPEVLEVNGIWGKYDIFVKIESLEPNGLDKTLSEIRKLPDITNSFTMPVLYGQNGTIDEHNN
jgi:DNA-binding Lrp family transcriptional regulator